MKRGDAAAWMWAEAWERLARAERMHRQFFEPQYAADARLPVWQPPVDVVQTEHEVLIVVALPGVDPAQVEAAIEDGTLHVAGQRVLPPELLTAVIHRLELPHGRFERRIPLPPGRYDAVRHIAANGCLLVRLAKAQ
ncbi:MAG: Hsp20/alpha crystallin family protein [Acetobacteraceae bacterium]